MKRTSQVTLNIVKSSINQIKVSHSSAVVFVTNGTNFLKTTMHCHSVYTIMIHVYALWLAVTYFTKHARSYKYTVTPFIRLAV
jgi:sRNA-binding regulator protein Hfq